MKSVSVWTIDDVHALVKANEPEGLRLEYKSSMSFKNEDKKKNEMAKDVSAMANSDGGIIVYGICEEEKENGKIKINLDDGVDLKEFSIESFEQVLRSKISPTISGIIIKEIQLGNGNFVILVQIDKSMNHAPHQSSDKKYYKRHNKIAEPMHDYEIKDIMRRQAAPIIEIQLNIDGIEYIDNSLIFNVYISYTNKSDQPAIYYSIRLFIPSNADVIFNAQYDFAGKHKIFEGQEDFSLFLQNCTPNIKLPAFKGLFARSEPIKVKSKGVGIHDEFSIFDFVIEFLAPGCSVRRYARAAILQGVATIRYLEM